MGWLFYDAKNYRPDGSVDRKKEADETFSESYTVLKSVMVASVHYAAVKNKRTGAVSAAVTLTSSDKRGSGFNFGYKGISENMGPCEAKCPRSILKLLTPTEDEYAIAWRDRCHTYHAQTDVFKNLPVGTKISWVATAGFSHFKEGECVTLEKVIPRGRGARWLCKAIPVYIKPKYVDMGEVKILAA